MTRSASWVEARTSPVALWREDPHPSRLSSDLRERWTRALSEWGAPRPVRDRLQQLAAGHHRVVVTGQQPGFWGGPLYSLYKAATAVALAERMTERTGRPTVPVFWVQGDDTDWDEVGWGALPRPDLGLVRHRWGSGVVPSRHWIGSARVDPVPEMSAVPALWNRTWGSRLPDIDPRRDLADGFAATLLACFGAHGLLPLDSRWPEVRAAGKELWDRYIPRREAISREVQEEGARLAEAGSPGSIDAAASAFGLFLLEGERRLPSDPETWESRARTLAADRPQDLAPSVLLRAPLQDHVLGNSAHVVGEAEGAYLRQIAPVYRELGIAEPTRIHRLRATLVPPEVPADRAAEIVSDPEGWLRERARATLPHPATNALAGLKEAVAMHLDTLAAVAPGNDALPAARRKFQSQIQRLEETALKQARKHLYRDRPSLRNLPEFLRPRRGFQERGLSAASLAFFFGDAAPEVILKVARDHLDHLEEGERHHFTLEAIGE